MAPSGFKKKPGRRPRAERRSHDRSEAAAYEIPEKKRRVECDVIEGMEVFSFENELELEYFANIEEPLPRKIRAFRGFDDGDNRAAGLLKNRFDRFVASVNVPRRDDVRRVEVSHVSEGSAVVLSEDDDVPHASTEGPVNVEDEPVRLVSDPATEVITIDSDSDSDDDVIMVSDPNAPIPQPVRDCVCPNCGKVKRVEQHPRGMSDKGSGVDEVSVVTDEVAIITDEDVPVESAPVQDATAPPQPEHLPPKESLAQPADIREEVAVQPAEVLTEVPSLAAAEVLMEEAPSPPAAKPLAVSKLPSPLKVNSVYSLADQPSPSPPSPSRLKRIMSPKPPMSRSQNSPTLLLPPAAVPPAVRVVSKESGKTFFLKIDGAKSKILKPPASPLIQPAQSNLCKSNNHLHSMHYPFPGQKPCDVTSAKAQTAKPLQEPPPKSVVAPRAVEVWKTQQPKEPPRSYCITVPPNPVPPNTVPPNTMRVLVSPGFCDMADGAKRVRNFGVPKAGIARDSSPRTGVVVVAPQSQVSQTAKTDADVPNDDVSGLGILKSPCLSDTKDAGLESPMSEFAKVESGITDASSEPLVLEDDTKSVVKDLVDFVCRKEIFPKSYPYDQARIEQLSLDVPCREFRCRMGCTCASLAKKNVRRVRCKNVDCIFGCICMSSSVVVPASRHAKTVPNVKVSSISRRKQVLTVLPDCDADGSLGTQPVLKSFLPVQKAAGVGRSFSHAVDSRPVAGSESHSPSSGSLGGKAPVVMRAGSVHGSSIIRGSTPRSSAPGSQSVHRGSALGSSTKSDSVGSPLAPKVPARKTDQRSHPTSGLAPANESLSPKPPDVPKPVATSTPCRDPAKQLSLPVAQPKRFFGREKIPIPERALVCLTPGLGYVPLEEIHPKVTLGNPFKPGSSKSFLSVRQATEWLNSMLRSNLNTSAELRWFVADKITIEKKQLNRLSVNSLKSPNCTISRTGAVFSS